MPARQKYKGHSIKAVAKRGLYDPRQLFWETALIKALVPRPPLPPGGVCENISAYIPYTRLIKRIRLFPKLQGNLRLLPNMRLIMKAKLTTPPNHDACLVARAT